jgi:hypothetical protein
MREKICHFADSLTLSHKAGGLVSVGKADPSISMAQGNLMPLAWTM